MTNQQIDLIVEFMLNINNVISELSDDERLIENHTILQTLEQTKKD